MKLIFVDKVVGVTGNLITADLWSTFQKKRKLNYKVKNPVFVEW